MNRTLSLTLLLLLTLAPASAQETGAPTRWTEAPVLLRVSDAISPGEVFGVYGEGFTGEKLEVLVQPGVVPLPPRTPTVAPTVLADHNGQFIFARLPESLRPAGLFSVWVRNERGLSPQRLIMNAPRPRWLSEREAWPGQTVRLVGVNFAASEFGGKDQTRVRLFPESAGKPVEMPIVACSPFDVRAQVPNVPPARYAVQVSNTSGRVWIRLPDETLTVVAKGEDPLGLGVSWAGDFHWQQRFSVADYRQGAGDDTAAIQAAINAAQAAGGGVAFIPAGEYTITGLKLPQGVVLLGEDQQRTILNYNGKGQPAVNSSSPDGLQGIARFTIRATSGEALPDIFIVLGQQWGDAAHDGTVRTATRLFAREVSVDYDLKTPNVPGHRGLGLLMIGKERGLIDKCSFSGYYASPHLVYLNDYFTCRDTLMEFSNGVLATGTSHCMLENNHIIGHRENVPDEAHNPGDIHGLFARDHLYAVGNLIEGMGVHEGEAICVENPGGAATYGKVLSANGLQMRLESAVPFDWAKFDYRKSYYSRWCVVIVAGRGLGQFRRVTACQNGEVTVDRLWDVVPDISSRFSLILPNDDVIMTRNTARDCTKGFWFYGNVLDGVAADNVSENSEGDFANSYHTPGGVYSMVYFIRMAREKIRGVSPRSHHAGVGFSTSRTSLFTYYGVHSFGLEIRDNDITGVPDAKPSAGSECPVISGLFGVFYSGYEGSPGCDRVGSLFAGNRLRDLQVGITLGRDNCGTVLTGNTFTNVVRRLEDRASKHLVNEDGTGP
jgi:hypothetical protein